MDICVTGLTSIIVFYSGKHLFPNFRQFNKTELLQIYPLHRKIFIDSPIHIVSTIFMDNGTCFALYKWSRDFIYKFLVLKFLVKIFASTNILSMLPSEWKHMSI